MTDRPTVLLPIRVLEGDGIPDGVSDLLANAHVVLLGYHVIPDQTAPGQARMQFEERATDRLAEFEAMLESRGATVETELVFTHEKQQTIDRQIRDHDCLAVLVPNATKLPESVLVAVRGTVGSSRIVRLVAGLFAGTDVDVTLYHLAAEDESDEDAETMLDAIRTQLVEGGIDETAIDLEIDHDSDSREAIIDAATSFDAVVMGESKPSLATFVFGMAADDVAEQFLGPVLVVQREKAEARE